MPSQKSKKPADGVAKTGAKPTSKVIPAATQPVSRHATKDQTVPASKTKASPEKATATDADKKKAGRPAKAAPAAAPVRIGAKRGPKPKGSIAAPDDFADIEAEFAEEPAAAAVVVLDANGEKVKPLRMKISKAKERALMKEFGLDETVLSEEDMAKRRLRLKALIKLGKTRGYLTHGEISDHLPDKLVDAETLEVVIAMLNDMGVAVYEQTPDAETLLLNNTAPTTATEEEAEEEAEAALSTVDSEFGRTTDPVRMYMREMGTVELLTREGEIEIAKRIEGGLMRMMEAISASPATIAECSACPKKSVKARS